MLQQVTAKVEPTLGPQVNSAVSLDRTCMVNVTFSHRFSALDNTFQNKKPEESEGRERYKVQCRTNLLSTCFVTAARSQHVCWAGTRYTLEFCTNSCSSVGASLDQICNTAVVSCFISPPARLRAARTLSSCDAPPSRSWVSFLTYQYCRLQEEAVMPKIYELGGSLIRFIQRQQRAGLSSPRRLERVLGNSMDLLKASHWLQLSGICSHRCFVLTSLSVTDTDRYSIPIIRVLSKRLTRLAVGEI